MLPVLGSPKYYLQIGDITQEQLIEQFCDKYTKCAPDILLNHLKSLNDKYFNSINDLHKNIIASFQQYDELYNQDYDNLIFTLKQKEEMIIIKNPKYYLNKIMQYEHTSLFTYLNIQSTKFLKCGKGHNMLRGDRTYESKMHHLKNCKQCYTEFENYSADEIKNGYIDVTKYTEKFNKIKEICQIRNEQYKIYLVEIRNPLQKEIDELTKNAQNLYSFINDFKIQKIKLVDEIIAKYCHTQFVIDNIIQETLQKIHLAFDDNSDTQYDITLIDLYALLLRSVAKKSFDSIDK